MDVKGHAALGPGRRLLLDLRPAAKPDAPPAPGSLLRQISAGALQVSSAKADVDVRSLQIQMCNIQRRHGLAPGGNGEWSAAAMTDLRAWLLKEPPQRGPVKRRAVTVGGSTSSVKRRAVTVRGSTSSSDSSSSSSSSSVKHQRGPVKRRAVTVRGSTSSSDSSSPSSSSVKRLRRTIAEAQEGLAMCLEPIRDCCPECGAAVAHVHNLLKSAIGP